MFFELQNFLKVFLIGVLSTKQNKLKENLKTRKKKGGNITKGKERREKKDGANGTASGWVLEGHEFNWWSTLTAVESRIVRLRNRQNISISKWAHVLTRVRFIVLLRKATL